MGEYAGRHRDGCRGFPGLLLTKSALRTASRFCSFALVASAGALQITAHVGAPRSSLTHSRTHSPAHSIPFSLPRSAPHRNTPSPPHSPPSKFFLRSDLVFGSHHWQLPATGYRSHGRTEFLQVRCFTFTVPPQCKVFRRLMFEAWKVPSLLYSHSMNKQRRCSAQAETFQFFQCE